MSTIWTLVVIIVLVAFIAVVFFAYQNYRARASMKKIDRSKLKNLEEDGWDDE